MIIIKIIPERVNKRIKINFEIYFENIHTNSNPILPPKMRILIFSPKISYKIFLTLYQPLVSAEKCT